MLNKLNKNKSTYYNILTNKMNQQNIICVINNMNNYKVRLDGFEKMIMGTDPNIDPNIDPNTKQNYDSDNNGSDESYSSASSIEYDSDNSISYYRRKHKFKKEFDKEFNKEFNKNFDNNFTRYFDYNFGIGGENFSLVNKNIGYTTGLTKDTPFVKYLIDKRMCFCHLGSSSHIAAFISVPLNSRCCFIQHGKWKGRYR